MQNWTLPLFLIKLVTFLGIFLALFYLKPTRLRRDTAQPLIDKNNKMLAMFSLVAFLSLGLFILIIILHGVP
jgi:hypothetical protein